MTGPTAIKTARFVLTDIIARHGCPSVLLSYNGSNFAHSILPRLNELMGIDSAHSAPYWPETNGMFERVNGILVKIVKKLAVDKPYSWDEYLPCAVMAYRVTNQSATRLARLSCSTVVKLPYLDT